MTTTRFRRRTTRSLAIGALLATIAAGACSGGETPRDSSIGVNGARATLDTTKIPEDLRHLAPLAQEWGIGDDVDRGDKVDASTPAERETLRQAVGPHHARITAWLDSFGDGASMTDEAAAFMYMQLALEEMPD